MKTVYDVGIIGGGIAGAFASLRATEKHSNSKCILFELGRPPSKRRRQLEGWLGCFPTGDGKIRPNNVEIVKSLVDGRKVIPAYKWVNNILSQAGPLKVITDRQPNQSVKNRIEELQFETQYNDYIQWKPENIHKLSRVISSQIIDSNIIKLSFDNEVYQILKKDDIFQISTRKDDFYCKNIILCTGRSGWRWSNDLYKSFGLIEDDNYAYYGVRIECSAQYMKEFNKTNMSLIRDDLEIGPLSWGGAVIPEDHADLVISSFRSNEDRWKRLGRDKVSFDLIGKRQFNGIGIDEMERLSKLAFLMFNDRVGREKVRSLIKKESMLSQLPEYDWIIDTIKELEHLFPSIISRSYFHSPTIKPQTAPINIMNNLETDVPNMFVAGESANLMGILSAAISGVVALDSALR